MAKFFLLSIIIATIVLPTRAARFKTPELGLRKAVQYMCVYGAFYGIGLLYLFGKTGVAHAIYLALIFVVYRYI